MRNSAEHAISKIKETETNAFDMEKKAQDRAQKLILDAKLEAKEMLFWAEVDAIARAHGILLQAKTFISAELDKITKNTHKEKQEIDKKAAANMPKAADFIIKEFLKYYGDSKA
ncbi:MAG: hypothetical protein JW946_04245 [Candidatus Omnitrophica bacterium]|nr:hypothetical protein [Candidatus Omnitrophota bacterium]